MSLRIILLSWNCQSKCSLCNSLQEVNENSLKRLSGYLENLQKPGTRSVQPTKLTFYVREIKDKEDIQKDILPHGNVLLACVKYRLYSIGVS